VHALGGWDNAVTVTTADDIGALTTEILFAEPRIVNQVVYTAGDTVTYAELADAVDTALGGKAQREVWTVPELQRELAADPDDSLKKYRVVFAAGNGVAWDKRKSFNAQRGITVCDTAQWIQQNLR
jgi:hypothetical protein